MMSSSAASGRLSVGESSYALRYISESAREALVTAVSSTVEEPLLTIPRPPRFWASPFGWSFAAAATVAVISTVALLIGSSRQPPEPVVTLKGIMASKAEFFNDPEVQRLLLKRHFRVEVTVRASREVALEVMAKPDSYDFAFPSGQPAANLITVDRTQKKLYNKVTQLFTSPIVLASYREYADTLVNNNVATAQGAPDTALYYTLDTDKFIKLGEQQKRWNDIGLSAHLNKDGKPITNGNQVLAHNSGVCRSNSAATYLALIAFVKNDNRPAQTETEIDHLAAQIKPLITAAGMPEAELLRSYMTPEGRSQGPIVVVYEHQYFAYQLERLHSTGKPDTDRVLLYPKQEFQADPAFISLKEGPADRLAELLRNDSELQRRMMELGYRVLDRSFTTGSDQLFQYLKAQGVPAPAEPSDRTRAEFPELDLLERLIKAVGRC